MVSSSMIWVGRHHHQSESRKCPCQHVEGEMVVEGPEFILLALVAFWVPKYLAIRWTSIWTNTHPNKLIVRIHYSHHHHGEKVFVVIKQRSRVSRFLDSDVFAIQRTANVMKIPYPFKLGWYAQPIFLCASLTSGTTSEIRFLDTRKAYIRSALFVPVAKCLSVTANFSPGSIGSLKDTLYAYLKYNNNGSFR